MTCRTSQSYGFRGEALPSIASVSRLTLRTRRREDDAGVMLSIEGGGPPTIAPCGIAAGTTIEVRDLFFNVPARRKFLRSLATESAHVTEVAEAAALAMPGLTLVLAREGRVVREWLRVTTREDRVRGAFGDEELSACRGERGPLRVEAFLSRPERARAAASALTLFVNGRAIRDRALLRSVAQAYGSVLEPGRYPLGVVYLEIDPDPRRCQRSSAKGRGALRRRPRGERGSLPRPRRRAGALFRDAGSHAQLEPSQARRTSRVPAAAVGDSRRTFRILGCRGARAALELLGGRANAAPGRRARG